jgi:HEPN domain-containing protein
MSDRTTPFGMWRYGNDFRKAAIAVGREHPDRAFMPYYFLLGQSIELSLKAFLMGRGIPLTELRKKYGHDLKALLDEARHRKLGIEVKLDNTHCAVIHMLGIEYLGKRFQYMRSGMMYLPDAWIAEESANRLSEGLEEYCKRVTKV